MKCNVARRLISLEVDDNLSAHDVIRLRAHLTECSECSAFAHDMRRLVSASSELQETCSREAFLLGVSRRIEASSSTPQRLMDRLWYVRRSLRLAGMLAGAACCIGIVVVVHVLGARRDAVQQVAAAEALQTVASQDIALSFGGPLDDLAAANLAALGAETPPLGEGCE